MSSDRLTEIATKVLSTTPTRRDLLKATACVLLTAPVATWSSRRALAADLDAVIGPWGDPATLVTAIGAGTLAAASVAETVEAYRKGFGYVEHYRGHVPREMAEFWGVPAMAGRAVSVMGPPGYQRGLIRIVELGKDFQEVSYPDTLGWIALEILVRSPDDLVNELKGLPFVHTGGPNTANDQEGKPLYRAAQFKGPSGEPLFMTRHMQLEPLMAGSRNNVGPLFIQTFSTTSYQDALNFYLKELKLKMRIEWQSPRTDLVKALGLKGDARYKSAAVRTPDYCALQIDEYPKEAPQRPAVPGCFAPGVSMCTLTTRNLDAVKAALQTAGIAFKEIEANTCPPFPHARAVSFVGKGGERVEIVETR
ncbi:MAG: hypothetical protein C0P74_007975 [Gammaproteobacteria bacterium]|nr:hypothetical protein [Gammaproteobacteria bacterium]